MDAEECGNELVIQTGAAGVSWRHHCELPAGHGGAHQVIDDDSAEPNVFVLRWVSIEDSIRRGLKDMAEGRTYPISQLWDEVEGGEG